MTIPPRRTSEQLTSFVEAVLPPHVEMPRIDEWERKLLGNLSGSVRIYSEERVLLVRSAEWYRQLLHKLQFLRYFGTYFGTYTLCHEL